MGISANQARFLSLTARQVDMEQRIQQICQRRLRLSSELENVATSYNNSISNRKMFTASQINQGIQGLSVSNLNKLGYKVIDATSKQEVRNTGLLNSLSAPSSSATSISSEQDFLNLLSVINGGDAIAAANALAGDYVLNCDIDLSDNGTFNKAVIDGIFTGTFDGQGHTISGANITTDGTQQYIGVFASNDGTIKNLNVSNVNISDTNDWTLLPLCYSYIGAMTGLNSGTIDNSSATASTINISGKDYGLIGGFAGQNKGAISNSFSTTQVKSGDNSEYVGGFIGDTGETATIATCYSTGDVTVGDYSKRIAGFKGGYDDINPVGSCAIISNCYSLGDVTAGINSDRVGGFISESRSTSSSVTSSYTTGNVTVGAGSTNVGGFAGLLTGGTVGADNYHQNNMSTDGTGSLAVTTPATATSSWDTTDIWDVSGSTPTLRGTNTTASMTLEEGLRNGTYSLAREADEFTQAPFQINGDSYQEVDWRTTPEIYDELNRGDDADAENKYDKIISEINAQDKKLQLEQTSVEVEYKAVSSEKEAVKKILDTNAQSSFKYFS